MNSFHSMLIPAEGWSLSFGISYRLSTYTPLSRLRGGGSSAHENECN